MINTLSFRSIHKSITKLDETNLPMFVVLTGKNGSGKTHLLSAIKNGQVSSSLVQNQTTDVLLFDSNTIIPNDTGMFDPAQDQTRRSQWFNTVQQHREQVFPGLQQFAIQLGIPSTHCSSIRAISKLNAEKLREIIPDPSLAEQIAQQLKDQIRAMGNNIGANSFNQIGDEYWRKTVPKIQQTSPEDFLISSQSRFFRNKHFIWGEVDPFQQAFGRVFTMYRELIHDNDRLEKYAPKDDPSRRHLNSNEFIEEYGTPPWDFVNQILEECKLDFRVDSPPLSEITSYEPKLSKITSQVEMKFQDLSSGEKVLMSFALCLYNSQDSRQTKNFPRLLLLDEVDAPLHPSMASSLLQTIQNVLVRDKNVAVILTTHSPSTVALAPEEAIYAMNPSGPMIEKVSKGSALMLLTAGVPTLSVAFDGRRQVFVESRTDASLYDLLYQKYKNFLNSERSLVFVEVGRKEVDGTEKNSGCDQVIRLVDALAMGGNKSVLGLVDWDGEKIKTKRLHVLSPGVRNGLESLLLDPVILVATVAKENIGFAKERSILSLEESYATLFTWDATRWQSAISTLQKLLLEDEYIPHETISIEYMNGMTLQVSKKYLHMDDHALERKVIKTFGFLMPKNKHAGGLMRHVVESILSDNIYIMPKDFIITMNSILTEEFE
ncbi:AAA family ATPase [Aquitalea pelogenes]|uniref:AAA family ATPase n=1 Tax=Aquitalea pelogenes TaxID=1293573 RepID=UPI0009E1A1C8